MLDIEQSSIAFRETIKQPPLIRLYDYWMSKSADGKIPSRSQIDPLDVPDLLPSIFLVDVFWDGQQPEFRFRLVGSKIAEIVGCDPTGQHFDDFYDSDNIERMKALYRHIAERGEPFINNSQAPFAGKDFVKLARLLLPLSEDGVQVDMILGSLYFENF